MPTELVASQFHVAAVFNCIFTGGRGTCFSWADSKGTYFVSAAHVLKGAWSGDKIGFARSGADPFLVEINDIVFAEDGSDVCIFSSTNFRLSWLLPLKDDEFTSIQLGQEMMFLGFPHGLSNTIKGMNGFSTPLVRKAFLAEPST
ncbi:hypothetical protein [Devosia aurantiaca]|uniref:Serine protease n=1 Tax=Devosia aurantiaca TaxID=2714858 RepID=A0A6M1T3B9_9HYPH|nr:hypothetical protein [Devosia aurantiaca]NGP19311.1 hypothetical protein [Devosia aurantiaca]